MMAFCPEHPKWDQNLKFTPLSETTSIPTPFICGVPLPRIWNNQSFPFHLKRKALGREPKGESESKLNERVKWLNGNEEHWHNRSQNQHKGVCARHENEKQQSVEQGNSMTNRRDRRNREETIKFTGEWQMWRVFITISRSILILKKWMVKLCCGLPCFCWFKKVT